MLEANKVIKFLKICVYSLNGFLLRHKHNIYNYRKKIRNLVTYSSQIVMYISKDNVY